MKLPDGWKIIKLNDVAVPLKRRNTIGNRNVLTSSAQFGLINQMEYHNRSMAGEDLSSYYLLYNGDFAYNRSSAKEYPFGAIRRLDKYDTGIVSSLYIPFTLKKDSCFSDFLAYVLDSELINQYLYQVCQEGARNHGLLNIAKEDFFQMPLYLPICQNEQRRIAEFLGTWDEAIEKLEKLIAAKEKRFHGLIQMLISGKKGQWATIRLGNLFSERNESNYPLGELLAITGERGVVRRSELDKVDSSSEDKSQYLRIYPGDIGYNTMRMWQGVCGVSRYDGIVSPAYTILVPAQNVNADFAVFYFKTPPVIHIFKRHSQGLVDDTLNLKYHHFSQIRLPFPELSEQNRIAGILTIAQNELNLLRKELAALQKQKRGLMQKLLTGTWRV